ncbi:MAG: hypothetical protein ACI37S_06365 [Candidatus Gastranaerophilaceae bacterium]
MFEGFLIPDLKDLDLVMPHAPYPIYPAGLKDSEKSHVRYAAPSTQKPTITLVDAIYAEDGTPVLLPGHYTLDITANMDYLLFIQSYDVIARVPIFKLEEDQNEVQKKYDKKEKRKARKKKKERAKIQKKYDEFGIKQKPEYIYSNAEIEYVSEKKFYLIKYEMGSVRAWAAIKQ